MQGKLHAKKICGYDPSYSRASDSVWGSYQLFEKTLIFLETLKSVNQSSKPASETQAPTNLTPTPCVLAP